MLITNAKIINFNKLSEYDSIYIKDGIIEDVGYSSDFLKLYQKEEIIDIKGRTLFPGLANAHMHGYGILSSYFMRKDFTWKDVFERLKEMQFQKEDMELIYYSAIMAGIFAIRNGVTTIFDICYGNPAISEMISEAYNILGLRGVVYQALSKKDLKFIKTYKNKRYGNVKIGIAISSNKEYLPIIEKLGNNDRILVHEDQVSGEEQNLFKSLSDNNLLSESIVFVHGTYSDHSLNLMDKAKVNLVSCPLVDELLESTCKKPLKNGINLCMGSGMLDVSIFIAAKEAFKHSDLSIKEIDNIIENNNNEMVYRILNQRVGKIEKGYKADFFIARANPIIHESDYSFVYRDNFWVQDVVIDGKFVLKDREIVGVKENEVYESIKEYALKL